MVIPLINDPILEKVFLALRTNFIPDFPKEHVTLRYYKEVRWTVLLQDAARLDKKLPATIIHKGVHMWKSGSMQYRGLHVSSPDSLILDHLSMPHITVPKAILEKTNIHEINSHEIVDSLWLGKSNGKGQYVWAKVSDAPVGYSALSNPEFMP